MRICGTRLGVLLVILAAVVIATGTDAYAKKPPKPGDGCPRTGIMCIDLWDPVICDDGNVYSNDCYAYVACATGCEPYGDGGPVVLEGKKKPGGGCPRVGIMCIDLWDPVICDDGQVYSNDCYAYVACATGCEPYGDGGPIVLEGKPGCDRPKFCPALWAPVICDDGKIYANDCYAQKKCATGCEPYGDWLMGGNCDRPKVCPKLWAPVICDDGKVYANSCWAQKKCATGCEPYDDGGPLAGKKKPGGDDGCPRVGIMCIDLWDPVICDDGNVYSNACYAWVACATGCEPYGDGGPIELE